MEMEALVRQVGEVLCARGGRLATAESCTGGGIAQAVTSVAGSSRWFDRGFVTYSNVSKSEMLGVAARTIETYGAVSEQVVREMAAGALARSHAQAALAVSGIAGPGGGSEEKPVGTVWLAWAVAGSPVRARRMFFSGDRETVRQQAVCAALAGMLECLRGE